MDSDNPKTINTPRALRPYRVKFHVSNPGELGAGLRSFTDTVMIEVASGDPGGESGEFAKILSSVLREWFDVMDVTAEELP